MLLFVGLVLLGFGGYNIFWRKQRDGFSVSVYLLGAFLAGIGATSL